MVRQGSAKPLHAGSILAQASSTVWGGSQGGHGTGLKNRLCGFDSHPPHQSNLLIEVAFKMSMSNIEQRLEEIERRNKRVELDKRWETSVIRRVFVAFFTYISIALYFYAIKIDKPFLNALVPTIGFLLSTLSLPYIRKIWEKSNNK